MNRREFLKLVGAGVITVGAGRWVWASQPSKSLPAAPSLGGDNKFRFIVLADTHVGKQDDKFKMQYSQVIKEITAMAGPQKPQAVFIAGDVTDSGYETGPFNEAHAGSRTDKQFSNFKAWIRDPLVSSGVPVYMVAGNHDGNHQSNLSEFCSRMEIPPYQSVDIQKTHFVLTCGVPDGVQGEYGQAYDPQKWAGPKTKMDTKKNRWAAQYGIGQAGCIDEKQLAWIEKDLRSDASRNANLTIMMNHFPLFADDAGGYQIQDCDYVGNPVMSGTKIRQWCDQYGVDVYLYGHRHRGYGSKLHDYSSGHKIMAALMDMTCGGTLYKYKDPNSGAPKSAVAGYDVFDVNGVTISHYRKILDTAGGRVIGPQQEWTLTAASKLATAAK